jgi:carbamoyl-phosphate synthase large subunit
MAKSAQFGSGSINIMFTCIGRRVSLLKSFRKAATSLKIKSVIIGTDTTELSPALQLCDKKVIVKPVTHRDYLKELLQIVKKNKVSLVIPTVDLDLKLLAKNKAKFEELGCRVLISTPQVIDICQDKRKTYRFLAKNGFDTPVTTSISSLRSKHIIKYPCFLKPWNGYASRGTAMVKNRSELIIFSRRIPNCIAQQYIDGVEHTCDVFVDFSGGIRCVVPRKRIEVRTGEVSKAQIIKNAMMMQKTAEVIKALGAGPGVITVQLILTREGKIEFIEINPRFGGGVPLTIKAGADFPKWILQQLIGKKPRIKFDGFKDGLTMLRYDGEIWLNSDKK